MSAADAPSLPSVEELARTLSARHGEEIANMFRSTYENAHRYAHGYPSSSILEDGRESMLRTDIMRQKSSNCEHIAAMLAFTSAAQTSMDFARGSQLVDVCREQAETVFDTWWGAFLRSDHETTQNENPQVFHDVVSPLAKSVSASVLKFVGKH